MSSAIEFIKKYIGHKKRAKIRRRLHKELDKLLYRKHYDAKEIISIMKSMGMQPGDVVFIHSSMREFYNYNGTAEELIETIESYLGPEGTLAMPAYPPKFWELSRTCLTKDYKGNKAPILFDVKETPTGAGYLAETFRKMPDVKRSINLQHSVCAKGKYADYLVSEHHLSRTCWDEKSPYYKLVTLNAKVFSFGLTYFVPTIHHCCESILWGKYDYFDQFFKRDITYNYKDINGTVGCHRMQTIDIIRKPENKRFIKKYFEKSLFIGLLKYEKTKQNFIYNPTVIINSPLNYNNSTN